MKKNNLRITYTVQYLLCDPPKLQISNFRFSTKFYDQHLSDQNRKRLINKYIPKRDYAESKYYGENGIDRVWEDEMVNLDMRICFLQSEMGRK